MPGARLLGLGMVLAACVPQDVSELPVERAAVPLDMTFVGRLAPGTRAGAMVEGASAGERVWLAMSTTTVPDATCPPVLPECLDLVAPTLLGSARADQNGRAVLSVQLPGVLRFVGQVWLQAGSATAVSSAQSRFVAGTPAGFTWLRNFGGYADPVSGVVDADAEWVWSGGGRSCRVRADLSSVGLGALPPCPQCDFAFEATVSGYHEPFGDCMGTLGLDVSGLGSEVWGIGFVQDAMLEYVVGYGWLPIGGDTFAYGRYYASYLGSDPFWVFFAETPY